MGGNKCEGIILTLRDHHLLEELEILKLVDREQAKLFAPFTSTTRANARLLALTRAGLLKRTFVGTINGGRKAIYFLPGQHHRALRRQLLVRDRAVAHQLAANQVYHAFRYASPPQSGVQFVEWRTIQKVLSPAVPLIPDGIVRFRTPVGEQVGCVEVDLGTESLRVWDRKVEMYLHLARRGEHRSLFEIERFKVLIVVSGARRLESIRARVVRQTQKLFWLATMAGVCGPGVWNPIWVRPLGDFTSRINCFPPE
jgi:hypothetical protein